MNGIQPAVPSKLEFFHTELAMARSFLEIAQTAREERAVNRNVHNAETSITAIRLALAERDIDPEHADQIRTAAEILSSRLSRILAR